MEEWKEITDYPNYEISNLGNVKNKTTKRLLKNTISSTGYYVIDLYKNGKGKKFKIHRLIAIAFIHNLENLQIIDHIDKNKLNNSLDNLRWTTQRNNCYNKIRKTQNSTSKYRGVCWDKKEKKWRVQIKLNDKTKHIGYFDIEEEGAKTFNDFVIFHNLQEFVDLNII